MITLTVIYPKTSESSFDIDYYLQIHVPLVKARLGDLGLEEIRLLRGNAGLDGKPPQFEVIAELRFSSVEQLQHALTQHGQEIIADIAKFTNVQPFLQTNERLA